MPICFAFADHPIRRTSDRSWSHQARDQTLVGYASNSNCLNCRLCNFQLDKGKDVQFAGEFVALDCAQGDGSTLVLEREILDPARVRSRYLRRRCGRLCAAGRCKNLFDSLVFAAFVSLIRCEAALAQSDGPDTSLIASERETVTAPVVIDGRALFRVRGVSSFPADQRAAMIAGRIRALAANETIPPSEIRVVASEHSTDIVAGDDSIMSVFDADANAEARGLPRQALAQTYLNRIVGAVEGYRAERRPERLARNAVLAGAWTLLLLLAVFIWFRTLRWLVVRIELSRSLRN